ncbi:MAG: ABC transporter permease [Pirellulales bacterium]|nr:ABC transporter permease [Pirellulales bacterium]
MYVLENPVLQRELLVNLRTNRAFLLLAVYQLLLAGVVLLAWPSDERLDLTTNPPSAQKLVNLFFLGQYVIASLMAPSFAAGAITGEKERHTYEMLLASPLRPGAIVLGKMVASLTHLGMLILASLPIIVLCLPLGGVSVYEVLAAYFGLIVSVILFGAIGVFCSSYFSRTSSSLVVSYLVILPLVILAVMFWRALEGDGLLRLKLAVLVVPSFVLSTVILMCAAAAGRMLYPPDVGSEGKEVIDLEKEAEEAVGLVIQPDQFPDRLFAPPKKQELMPDGSNPVYDKEIHSEIFSQGTLMLRLVIQISMLLAIPLMGVFLFWQIERAAWFSVFVIVFNMLVGPVFLAGSMTSERERQTLDLLLTTTLSPWQILSGKFVVGFRISAVLTSFLLWPLLLGTILNNRFWTNWEAVLLFFAIVLMVCLVNAVVALVCSLFQKKTSIALLSTYVLLLLLYVAPPAVVSLLQILDFTPQQIAQSHWLGVTSPFSALFAVPLDENLKRDFDELPANIGNLKIVAGYFIFSTLLLAVSSIAMVLRLRSRRGLGE